MDNDTGEITGVDEPTKIEGVGIRWTDGEGLTHAVDGKEVPDGGMLMWPRCGQGEVPLGAAKFGNTAVTCPQCAALLAGASPPLLRETRLAPRRLALHPRSEDAATPRSAPHKRAETTLH